MESVHSLSWAENDLENDKSPLYSSQHVLNQAPGSNIADRAPKGFSD